MKRIIVVIAALLATVAVTAASAEPAAIKIGMIATEDESQENLENVSPGSIQDTSEEEGISFFSVSGDFARAWLTKFQNQSPEPEGKDVQDLWSWGGLPMGKAFVGGEIVSVENYSVIQRYSDWLGVFPPAESAPLTNDSENEWIPPL